MLHPPVQGGTAFGNLPLTVLEGKIYHVAITNNDQLGPAQHYTIGAVERPDVELGWGPALHYLEGGRNNWAIHTDAGEAVELVISTDDPALGGNVPDQATQVEYAVAFPGGADIVPQTLDPISPTQPIKIQFTSDKAQTFILKVFGDRHYRMQKTTGSDPGFYATSCPPKRPQPPKLGIQPFMTDTEFNPIDSFDVLFTRDKATDSYKIPATNPGEYYYNSVIKNQEDKDLKTTLVLQIPAAITRASEVAGSPAKVTAFTLVGGMPVHVYSSDLVPGGTDATDVTASATIEVPPDGRTVKVTFIVPAGGIRYTTIHLNWGLKGDTGYDRSEQGTYFQPFGFRAAFEIEGFGSFPAGTGIIAVGKRVTAIAGLVRDTNGNPKFGLQAQLFDDTGAAPIGAVVPADGFYFLPAPGAGTYTVKILDALGGVKKVSGPQVLLKDDFRLLNFEVNPADPVVYGFVSDSDGNGVGGVTVELYHIKSGKLKASVETQAGGKYAFRFSAPGEYRVEVVAPEGYVADQPSANLKLKQFEEVQVNFTLHQK